LRAGELSQEYAAAKAILKSLLRFRALELFIGVMLLLFPVHHMPPAVHAMQQPAYGDKLLHFTAQAVLMPWFSGNFPTRTSASGSR
jgi:hypothetical protein